jgi:hypothetical protein
VSTILDALKKANDEKSEVRSAIEHGTLYRQTHASSPSGSSSSRREGGGLSTALLAVGVLFVTASVFVGVIVWASGRAQQPNGTQPAAVSAAVPPAAQRQTTAGQLSQYSQIQLQPAIQVPLDPIVEDLPEPEPLAAEGADTERNWDDEVTEETIEPYRPTYRLEGIVWDEENPMAMVNGQIVNVGDWVGDAEVTSIETSTVILQEGDRTVTLRP